MLLLVFALKPNGELGRREFRWIGLAVALLAALPAAPTVAMDAVGSRLTIWVVTFGVFVGLLFLVGGEACGRWSAARRGFLLSSIGLAALALVALGGGAFAATYPVLAAAVAGSVLPRRAAFGFVGAQSIGLAVAFGVSGLAVGSAISYALLFGALQLFVVHTAQMASAERAARRALEIAQERLADSSRDAERLRISRELHDVMGHHLTALSLTLEAASHAVGEAKDGAVSEALVLTKRLLRDVRQVVSTLREEGDDLDSELYRIAAEAKGVAVQWTPPAAPMAIRGASGRAILRCAQETITNAARHGGARNLWLVLESSGGGLRFVARDDGLPKSAPIEAGNGLRGIGERFSELGGWVRWGPSADGGFELVAWLPEPAEPAPTTAPGTVPGTGP